MSNDKTEDRSYHAIKQCAEWLAYCLKIGYDKSDLDILERIWWEYHDPKTGKIKQLPITEVK